MRGGDPGQPVFADQGSEGTRIDRVGPARDRLERDAAIAFEQRIIALDPRIDRSPRTLAKRQAAQFRPSRSIVAVGRGAAPDFGLGRLETAAEDDVDDPLISGIAIFQRDLLGQHFHSLDRFGGQIAKLAKARDALAVEEQDRPAATATARTAGLGSDRVEQFGNAGRPGGADIASVEYIFRRDVADHRAARALAGDDDFFFIRCVVDRSRTASIMCRGLCHRRPCGSRNK